MYKKKFSEDQKYKSSHVKKDYGHGFVFEEMVTVQGFDNFVN